VKSAKSARQSSSTMSWLLGRNRQQPQPEQSGGFADGGGGADPDGRTKMVFWLRSNMVGSPGQLKSHENQTNAKS